MKFRKMDLIARMIDETLDSLTGATIVNPSPFLGKIVLRKKTPTLIMENVILPTHLTMESVD